MTTLTNTDYSQTTYTPLLTQRQRILTALRSGPVCGTTFLRWGIPRYAARIYELRQEGYEITKEVCRLHDHRSRQWMWRLDS